MENRQLRVLILLILISFWAPTAHAQEKKKLSTNGQEFIHQTREQAHRPPKHNNLCPNSPYRTIDGTCNNRQRRETIDWGASDIELGRSMLPYYGSSDHNNAMGGENRVSPRKISNELSSQTSETPSPRNLSSFVFTWGQFIDHDISLTPEGSSEYEPIILPTDEPLFTSDIHFFRSEVFGNTGNGDYRQQTNLITSYIDGSNIYGSDKDRASWLRTKRDGKLKTSKGDLLPFNTVSGEYDAPIDPNAPSMAGDQGGTAKTFVAGDIRAAEQPGLTSLHTLFVRHHNRICDQLKRQRIFNDEELYQKAKKEVGAILQSITYNEFLPAMGLKIGTGGGYNDRMNAEITNIFASAAYRFGHTMVTEELLLLDNNCDDVANGTLPLLEGFFNPQVVRDYNIGPILKGLSVQVQNEVDLLIIDNLRNFLFGNPAAGNAAGLDLASLNIQRGRDHGLPDYNSVRRYFTGRPIKDFSEISTDRKITEALEDLYDDVNDIDLWIGLLAEDKLKNSSLGFTITALLRDQFIRLRDGDRYFFTHDNYFSRQDLDRLESTTLADIIIINTPINSVQNDVFKAEVCVNNINNLNDSRESENTKPVSLEIYPNPAQNSLTVSIGELETQFIHAQIIDLSGRIVKAFSLYSGTHTINIQSLPPGSYQLIIDSGDINLRKAFVKIKE